MPYYSGDYYVGDYYTGDPGFGSFLGKIFSPFVAPVKAVVGAVRGALGGGSPAAAGIASRAGAMARAGAPIVRRVGGAVARHPVLTAAGAAGTIGVLAGRPRGVAPMQGVAPRGFHISRMTGAIVKNRRMRVTNPRALRRAIRRATGFARLAKRVLRFTSPRPPRGRAYFKVRGRSRARMKA